MLAETNQFTLGMHEIETVVAGICSVAAFFIALWIRGIKEDVHDLVRLVNEHTERIAKLEIRVDGLEKRKP